MGRDGPVQCGPHGMYGVGLAIPPLTGEALFFFSQYDCTGSAGTDVFAQDVPIVPDTGGPAYGFLFSTPYYGRTHCPTHGGMQGSRGCPLASYECALVPVAAARHCEVPVAQCEWWHQELVVPSLEDDSVRGGLAQFG